MTLEELKIMRDKFYDSLDAQQQKKYLMGNWEERPFPLTKEEMNIVIASNYSIEKFNKLMYDEITPFQIELGKVYSRTVPEYIYNPQKGELHQVRSKHPYVLALEEEIERIINKYKKIYENYGGNIAFR